MDLNNLLIPSKYSMDNSGNNLEPTRIERNGFANEPVTDKTIFTTGQQINGQIQHQLAQFMIKEFNRQTIPILSSHSQQAQLKQKFKSEPTSQQFLRQIIYQNVSLIQKSMEYLTQRTLIQPSAP